MSANKHSFSVVFHEEPTAFNLAVALIGASDEYRYLPVVVEENLGGYITNIKDAIRVWEDEDRMEYILYDSIEEFLDAEGVDDVDEVESDWERVLVIS